VPNIFLLYLILILKIKGVVDELKLMKVFKLKIWIN